MFYKRDSAPCSLSPSLFDATRKILRRWDGLGVANEIRAVLNAGVRSLFFNGQFDLICNHVR